MRNKKLIAIFSVLTVLTLLILLNSVIFSVQHINAYCYNADGDELEESVLSSSNVRRGSSIFLLEEERVIRDVERDVPGVRVINVERKFPNRVYINYVQIFEYLKLISGDKVYCISNDGEVLRVLEQSEAAGLNLVELRLNGNFLGVDENNKIISSNPSDLTMLEILLNSFQRLLYKNEFVQLFDTVDFTKNFVYLKTRTGLYWELQTVENSYEKLRLALSTYVEYGSESQMWKKGTLIIAGGDSVKISYTELDRYTYGVS